MNNPARPVAPAESLEDGTAMRHMLEAAQRFLVCRDRLTLYTRWADPPPARSLAEAIGERGLGERGLGERGLTIG